MQKGLTGKMTMMLQALEKINDYEHSIFIRCGSSNTMMQVRKEIEAHPECRYIFVDEVTNVSNFINTSSVFANFYTAKGKKVVIAGADTLSLFLAAHDELDRRITMIPTTSIPFDEYHFLLGKDMMDHVRHGGTLCPENVFSNRDNL